MDAANNQIGFRDSTAHLNDGGALRGRAEEDGYLYFRKLLPADAVQEVRHDLLGVVEALGWLDEEKELGDGVLNLEALCSVPLDEMRTDIGVTYHGYSEAQKLESVHRLPHHPVLKGLYRVLFGTEVLVHPRHIIRMVTPHPAMVPTPIHQDFPLIQGSPETWTCWFPLGGCSKEMGGLSVLRGSNRLGYLPVQFAEGAGGITAQLCPGETAWVSGDFELGDVLTFPSYTVHRALPCRVPDRIRLSMDIRYQSTDDIIEEKSLLPHCELTWDEIYADWKSEDLKYYWRNLALNYVPWDADLMQPSQRIC